MSEFSFSMLKIKEDIFKPLNYNRDMEARDIFKTNLIKLRKEMKWTQYDLAARTGISTKQITRLETGDSFPSSKSLDLLSNAFKIPISSFFIDPRDPYATIDIAPFYELNKHISQFYVTAIKETADELTRKMAGLLKEGIFDRLEFEKLIAPNAIKSLLSGIGHDTSDSFAEKIALQLAKKLVLDTNNKLDEQEEKAKERKSHRK